MRDFTVLILAGAFPTSVSATLDMLAAAGTLAARAGSPVPRWGVFSVDGGTIALANGLSVETRRLPARPRDDRSIWILPGLGLNTPDAVHKRLAEADALKLIAALTRHARSGGQLAASCSAVFLLGAAGLLDGRRVTTTWWLAPLLKRQQPACTVDADRMICAEGPVTTAGAAMAQSDLMLHLLRRRCGSALADAVSRSMLIDARQSQSPYIVPQTLASGDDLVARLSRRIEKSLPHPPAVSELAREFCMTERTLSRRIHRVTGKSTVALTQSVRLQRARLLIETSRMTIDQVAEAVGYRDSTALRRLMSRMGHSTPSRYRPAIAPD